MTVTEITAKSLLRKHKRIDPWFVSRYGMNLYRGCTHNCIYCDGRAEGYYVEGEFGKDVAVKVNAVELLRRELNPTRKRVPLKRGFIMVGGGVGDSYQPAEDKYRLTRRVLETIYEYDFPVHLLTKSTLLSRDIDIIRRVNEKSRALVSFSLSSANDEISAVLEPGVPPPSKRLETLSQLKHQGIPCGVFLLPVVPMITDTPEIMEDSVRKIKNAGADYILFGGMTLKEGRQKEYFTEVISRYYPELLSQYDRIYKGGKWGETSGEYYRQLNERYYRIACHYDIPMSIPAPLFRDMVGERDLVSAILGQMDYLSRLRGAKSPFGYASYVVSQIKEPIATMQTKPIDIEGISNAIADIISEILETGDSEVYDRMLYG